MFCRMSVVCFPMDSGSETLMPYKRRVVKAKVKVKIVLFPAHGYTGVRTL